MQNTAGAALHEGVDWSPLDAVIRKGSHADVLTIERVQDLFRESWTTSADLWLRGGRVPQEGELFANPVYASVLERLAIGDGPEHGVHRLGRVEVPWRGPQVVDDRLMSARAHSSPIGALRKRLQR